MWQDLTVTIDFTAIDFETANRNGASACAVGLARIRNGIIVEQTQWLIKPPAETGPFDFFNTKIHGITAEMVEDAPLWQDQLANLTSFIGNDIVIAHNAGFDMGVIQKACQLTVTPTPKIRYLCSVKVSRKTYTLQSHSLPYAAEAAGFTDFNHHNALDDALACSHIISDAARIHGQESVPALAKALGLQVTTLKAIPIKM